MRLEYTAEEMDKLYRSRIVEAASPTFVAIDQVSGS